MAGAAARAFASRGAFVLAAALLAAPAWGAEDDPPEFGPEAVQAMAELGTLHEFRWQMPRDINGHILLIPGAVEALRMVAEGLEKTTGTERLDGIWGYERRPVPERRANPGSKRANIANTTRSSGA